MSTTNVNQGTNRPIFQDGEGLTSTDLTAIGALASQRAWDAPGHASLLAFDGAPDYAHYATAFAGGSYSPGMKNGVFTVGGGLVAVPNIGGNSSSLCPGFLGLWDESRVSPPLSTDTLPRMSWVWVGASDWSGGTHASATTTRYDLVHCAIARSNLTASRDFKDLTTGALTSQPTEIIAEQLAVDIQMATGVDGGSLPALPSGRHALYAVRVTSAGVQQVYDFTIPVGTMVTAESLPPYSAIPLGGSAPWHSVPVAGGYLGNLIDAASAGSVYVFPPENIRGNPNARILGFDMNHKLMASDTVKLVQVDCASIGGGYTPTVLWDLGTVVGASSFDSTQRDSGFVDLRGWPSAAPNWSPVWGNGQSSRTTAAHKSIALQISAAIIGSQINAITWYAIRG